MNITRLLTYAALSLACIAAPLYAQAPSPDPMATAAPPVGASAPVVLTPHADAPPGNPPASPPHGDMAAPPPPPPTPPRGGDMPPPPPPPPGPDVVHLPRAEYEALIRANAASAALSKPVLEEMDIGKLAAGYAPLIALLLIPLILMIKYRSEQRAANLLLDEYSSRVMLENLAEDLRASQERQAALLTTIVAALEGEGKVTIPTL